MTAIPKIKWCPIHKQFNYVLVDERTGKKIESGKSISDKIQNKKGLTDLLGGPFS